jgi:hypothetical protein
MRRKASVRHVSEQHHRAAVPVSRSAAPTSRSWIPAIEPEVIEQLRVWAVELAEEAEQTEWSAAQ